MSNFRKGFLLGLAENGITPSDVESFIEKHAAPNFQAPIIVTGGGIGESIGNIAKGVGSAVVDFPIAASVLGGGLAGIGGGLLYHNLLNKMTTDPQHDELKRLKNMEIIKELKFQSDLIKQRQGMHKLSAQSTTGIPKLNPGAKATSCKMPQMPKWGDQKKRKAESEIRNPVQ